LLERLGRSSPGQTEGAAHRSAKYFAPVVIVTGDEFFHMLAADLLAELRGGAAGIEPPTVKNIRDKLDAPVTLEFVETPLGDVLRFLHDYTGLNIVVDRASLSDQGITTDHPVTLHVERVPLRSALSLLLGAMNLTFDIENECLVIRSIPDSSRRPVLRVYPVGRLTGKQGELAAEDWKALLADLPQIRSLLRAADERTSEEGSPRAVSTVVEYEYFSTTGSLVILGPRALQADVENLIGLVTKAFQPSNPSSGPSRY
jgi:hypothetical protein